MLFYRSHPERNSILAEQTANIEATTIGSISCATSGLAADRLRCRDVDAVGEAMHKGWKASGNGRRHFRSPGRHGDRAGPRGRGVEGQAGRRRGAVATCSSSAGGRRRADPRESGRHARIAIALDRLGSRIVLNVQRDID